MADWLNCPLSIVQGIFGEGGNNICPGDDAMLVPPREGAGRELERTREVKEREGKKWRGRKKEN